MKIFIPVIFVLAVVCSGCGGEIDLTALIENCVDYCEKRAECDRSLPVAFVDECSDSCERGELNNPDYNVSETLMSCNQYEECADFKLCVSRGGSLTDDEYGGLDGGQ